MLGQLHWGTLIALNDGAAPIVGLMRQPYTGETFIGSAAGSELRRGSSTTRLTARAASRLADVTVCATDPTMFAGAAHQQAFARLAPRARSVRFGGDCYTPCLVAGGWADLVVEAGLKPWDVQALIPIVQGAGGVITDWAGGPADRASEVIIAANRALHAGGRGGARLVVPGEIGETQQCINRSCCSAEFPVSPGTVGSSPENVTAFAPSTVPIFARSLTSSSTSCSKRSRPSTTAPGPMTMRGGRRLLLDQFWFGFSTRMPPSTREPAPT